MKHKYFDIIHEDMDLVIVNKSPDVLTIPDRHSPNKFNLYNWLQGHYGQIFVVHRLDKETSGVLVFARNEESHRNLSQQFMERDIRKIYLTLVEGVMHQEDGIIDKPIEPDPSNPGQMMIDKKGKPSITAYHVIERFKNYSLVEADIKTGRTHQIRVHFKAIGFPLAVDAMYGRKPSFLLSDVKQGKYQLGKGQEEMPLMSRVSLHAQKLSFLHPTTGNPVSFEAPLPKDFAAVVKQLQKWGK